MQWFFCTKTYIHIVSLSGICVVILTPNDHRRWSISGDTSDNPPAPVEYIWHVHLGEPETEGDHDHPQDGDLVDELTDEAEGTVVVERPQADHHLQQPHGVDASAHESGVRPGEVHQDGRDEYELDIADL